ncbi:MAG: phage holin family protein [Arthrobacter sp.]|uniref:phage holin family protein n=1 Tax=Arthrobacter sp. TaxID=1667 RepID=UPI003486410D
MSDYQQPPSVANPPPSEAQDRAATNSVGELFGELTRDLSTLVRQEVELAKAEVRESATSAGKGAGMLAGAGVAGHFVLLFLSLGLMWALGSVLHLGWAAVIVAVLWGIAAAVLTAVGKKKLKEVKGLPQTAATVKKIPPTMKPGEETP